MATTVVKNAGRAKYNAAQKKHAQRDPLPPRGDDSRSRANDIVKEAAEAVVAEVKAKRIKPRPRPSSDPGTESVGRLLGGLAAPVRKRPAAKPAPAPVEEKAPESKAGAFAHVAFEAGWIVETIQQTGSVTAVTATRGTETVVAAWDSGRWSYADSSHTISGHRRALINASAGKKALTTPVDAVSVPAVRRESGDKAATAPRRRALPFSPAEATDEAVLAAVLGYKLTWRNGMTDEVTEAGVVPLNGKSTKLEDDDLDDPSTRQLTFCDAEGGGYRSLRLGSLLSVSAKRVDDGHMLTFMMARARDAMKKGSS